MLHEMPGFFSIVALLVSYGHVKLGLRFGIAHYGAVLGYLTLHLFFTHLGGMEWLFNLGLFVYVTILCVFILQIYRLRSCQ